MMNSGDSVQWLTYQESMAIRRAMIARHHEYIERRLVQNMPTKLVLAASIALIVIGLVELALQIVLIAESGPLYYIAHGIWGALVTFSFSAMCLILCKTSTTLYNRCSLSFETNFKRSLLIYLPINLMAKLREVVKKKRH